MSEILTESFCERCGTRYTFESARSKVRLKGVRVLSRGLKNFVLSDDTTLDEAMAAARSETDRESTAHQLDAFHKTFNFCMSCRQYTCPNCWNEVEARCQSCAPLPESEIATPVAEPGAFPGLVTLAETAAIAEPASNGTNGHHHDGFPSASAAADAATLDAILAEPQAGAPEPDAATALPSPEELAEPAAKAISQTSGLLHRFRPGESLDDELAAFELGRSSADVPEPVERVEEPVGASIETDAIVEAATEPGAMDQDASTEAEAAAPHPIEAVADASIGEELVAEPAAAEPVAAEAIVAEPGHEPASLPGEPAAPEPPASSAADIVEQPTWRITAPDVEAPETVVPTTHEQIAPIQATEPSAPPVEPQWPARPEWPAPQASVGLPFLGRPAAPQGGVDSLWAASNRELVATPPAPGRLTSGIQPCVSCGLSLSANARFCRRCGTLQGG